MYGKIFETIYDGTLVEDWRALVTFQQFLILCNPDGILDMTPKAISRRTGIPIEIIEPGIIALEKPDPESRTPDEEGRRIVKLNDHRPWGWRIVNHSKYKNFKSGKDRREYMKNYMRNHRAKSEEKTDVTSKNNEENQQPRKHVNVNSKPCKQQLAMLRHTDTDTDTDTVKDMRSAPADSPTLCPHQKIINLYHEILKNNPQVKDWTPTRQQKLNARWREDPTRQNLDWWRQFFEYISRSKFLTGQIEPREGKKRFRPGLHWLLEKEKFTRILEGEYDDDEN